MENKTKQTTTGTTNAGEGTETQRRRPSFIAWHVRDGRAPFWDRVGVAWANKDGGFTVQLHAVPLSGRIVLRKPETQR